MEVKVTNNDIITDVKNKKVNNTNNVDVYDNNITNHVIVTDKDIKTAAENEALEDEFTDEEYHYLNMLNALSPNDIVDLIEEDSDRIRFDEDGDLDDWLLAEAGYLDDDRYRNDE